METFGWDTVFMVDAAVANRGLAANTGQLAMTFDADPQTEPPLRAQGTFSAWRIVPGGSERYAYLALDIKQGTLTIGAGTRSPIAISISPPVSAAQKSYDLAGVSVVVSVDLKVLRNAPYQSESVQFNVSQVGNAWPPPGPGYVIPIAVVDPANLLDVAAQSLLGFAIADSLVKDAAKVRYIFASINPVPPQQDSWLAPKVSDFVFSAREHNADPAISILSLTQETSTAGLPRAVDRAALTGDANVSYVISGDLTLEKLIMPVLPQAYQTTPDSFRFDKANHKVLNAREFGTFSVKSGAITYYPIIESFEQRIEGDVLRTAVRGRCDMKAGIWMYFYVNTANRSSFNAATKELTFLADPGPISDSRADIPWYFFFLGPLVIAITQICVSVISKDIAGKLNDLLRNALSITKNPPRVVEWTGTQGFTVTSAGLNRSLYMMGKYNEAL